MSLVTPLAHLKSASVIVAICFGSFLKEVKYTKSFGMPHNVQGKYFYFKPTISSINSFHYCVSENSYNHCLISLSYDSFVSTMGDTSKNPFDVYFSCRVQQNI
jgi:hypothetical protein